MRIKTGFATMIFQKVIYDVKAPLVLYFHRAKLCSAGHRKDGNAVSVNFIKCVRGVRDTVNSPRRAYIEFSCLNGNLRLII